MTRKPITILAAAVLCLAGLFGDAPTQAQAQTVTCQAQASVLSAASTALARVGPAQPIINLTTALAAPAQPTATRLEALSARAAVRAQTFDFDGAIADITAAIDTAQTAQASPFCLARLHKQRGDHIFLLYEWDRVLTDYDTAVTLAPTYADAYFARGVLYYTQGPRTSALTDFEQVVALTPTSPRAAEAQAYIQSIRTELEALGGDDTGAFGPSD